ncbi:bifunctional DNA primase/polymerase [Catellatospora methionotrophica]|uniref:bifunctional DNA primase/polymerase n=1 Tax=Catellatospora methionotrophica TaxID=121620 RepID=UPI001408BAB6|nr:bifunctional DNA primase/polymerase [Catellatospora methionotrophica]
MISESSVATESKVTQRPAAAPQSGLDLVVDMESIALQYAVFAGWPVFPVHWTDEHGCSCRKDCGRDAGKHPRTPHGVLDATTDAAQVAAWWQEWPLANIGIATGAPGPDVLDFDVKNGGLGMETYQRLRAAGLLRGVQATVTTPSGGCHLYFPAGGHRSGAPKADGKALGLDIQCQGKYVLAPPSRIFGRKYRLTGKRHRQHPAVHAADIPAILQLLSPAPPVPAPRPARERQPGEISPGDDFEARADWADQMLLGGAGWTFVRQRGAALQWRRPGKDGGKSALTGGDRGDLFSVFTSEAPPFDKDVSYSKFAVYTLLHHGGDFSAAARELRRIGYGSVGAVS